MGNFWLRLIEIDKVSKLLNKEFKGKDFATASHLLGTIQHWLLLHKHPFHYTEFSIETDAGSTGTFIIKNITSRFF